MEAAFAIILQDYTKDEEECTGDREERLSIRSSERMQHGETG